MEKEWNNKQIYFWYKRVDWGFLKSIFLYSLFLAAFAVVFYVIAHNDVGDTALDVESLSPHVFMNIPWSALAYTFAIVTGEVDFNNMTISISYKRREGGSSTTLANVNFLLFIILKVNLKNQIVNNTNT